MAKHTATQTFLLCPRCGMISSIFRRTCRQKSYGHLKNLYCYKCKHTHNHIEVKDASLSQADIEIIINNYKNPR